MRTLLPAATSSIVMLLLTSGLQAQTARRSTVTVQVTDGAGNPLGGVAVKATGPVDRDAATDETGQVLLRNIPAGTMRLRFEQEGFVTLEREVDIAAGRARRVEVMLSAAPAAAPPAAPPAEPAPAPTPTEPAGEPVTLMIPDFVEKNFIGRAPYKESLLACTAVATVTLLQFRDPLELHTHDRADEILYVVAGEAVHQIGERTERVTFGSLIVVPRGTPHSMTRRGSNPVIALSIAAGQPCQAPVVASR